MELDFPSVVSQLTTILEFYASFVQELKQQVQFQENQNLKFTKKNDVLKEQQGKVEEEMTSMRRELQNLKQIAIKNQTQSKEIHSLKEKYRDKDAELSLIKNDNEIRCKKLEHIVTEKSNSNREIALQLSEAKSVKDLFEFQLEAEKLKNQELAKQLKILSEKENTHEKESRQLKLMHMQELETMKQKYEEQLLNNTGTKSNQDVWRQKAHQMQTENSELKTKISHLEEKLSETNKTAGNKRKLVPQSFLQSNSREKLSEWN